MEKLNRYHVFTDCGRKIKFADSPESAKRAVESCGFKVVSVKLQPDPLKDAAEMGF